MNNTKVCTKCKEKLPETAEYFYRDKDKKSGLRTACKSCVDKQRKKYIKKNKEKIKTHRKRYNDKNKEKIRESNRLYRKNNKENRKIQKQIRRSREAKVTNSYDEQMWIECKIHFKNKCAYCGMENESLTREHFIPVSKGGEYSVNNILPICGSCNSSKRDKDFFFWYPLMTFYSLRREQKILKYLGYQENKQQLALFK